MSKKGRTYTMLIFCTLLFALLTGCLDDTPETNSHSQNRDGTSDKDIESEPAPEPEPTPETGAIQGQVVNDAYEPISGAMIALSNSTGTFAESITDEKGKYTINGIPPGKYGIRFTAECCQEHLDQIRVNADRTSTSSPVLTAWGGHEPYVHPDEWHGFLCGEGLPFLTYCSTADPNHEQQHDFEVDRGIKTLLVAMDWEEGINLKDCLYLRLRVPPFQHDDYDTAWLESSEPCQERPIEFRLDAGKMTDIQIGSPEEHDFENITDWMPLQYGVEAQGGVITTDPPQNLVFQQPFTVYWEEHYWEYAPEGASALPDQ